MTQAQDATEAFHRRAARGGTAKFSGGRMKGVKIETSPDAPGATFYRFPDGSLARVDRDNGGITDVQPF